MEGFSDISILLKKMGVIASSTWAKKRPFCFLPWPKSGDRIPPLVLALGPWPDPPHVRARWPPKIHLWRRTLPHLGGIDLAPLRTLSKPLGEGIGDPCIQNCPRAGRPGEGALILPGAPVQMGVYGRQILAKSGNNGVAFWPKSTMR